MRTQPSAVPRPSRREVLALATTLFAGTPTFAQPSRSHGQEAVAAYLNAVAGEMSAGKMLVFAPSTATVDEVFMGRVDALRLLKTELPEASDAVMADFLRLLNTPSPLELSRRFVRNEVQWVVARQSDVDHIFGDQSSSDSWKAFYRQFPTGIGLTRLSRVGLDEESKQALFYLSTASGRLGGSGHFILMQRRLGIWRLLSSKQAWIS